MGCAKKVRMVAVFAAPGASPPRLSPSPSPSPTCGATVAGS